jgi:hypothetical protein
MIKTFLLFVFAVVLFNFKLFAKEDRRAEIAHNHHLAAYMGSAFETKDNASFAVFGLEYEFRPPVFSNDFGFGGLAEYIHAEKAEYVLGVPLYWHPSHLLKVFAAPALSFSDKEELKRDPITMQLEKSESSQTHFMIRIGAGADFHINRVSLSPIISADFMDSKTILNIGVSFGWSM